jgi:membrane-associated phospholipid phosphatase
MPAPSILPPLPIDETPSLPHPRLVKPIGWLPLWVIVIIGVALTCAAMPFDQAIAGWAVHNHPLPVGNDAARELMMLEQYGQVVSSVLVIIAVGLVDPRGPRRALVIALGCIATVLVCYLLKGGIGRARPHTFDPVQAYQFFGPGMGFTHGSKYQSFPSAHTTGAVALAAGLAAAFPRGSILFYCLALQVMIQRVLHADHYLSDVIAGALLAIVMVRLSISYRWFDRVFVTDAPPPA